MKKSHSKLTKSVKSRRTSKDGPKQPAANDEDEVEMDISDNSPSTGPKLNGPTPIAIANDVDVPELGITNKELEAMDLEEEKVREIMSRCPNMPSNKLEFIKGFYDGVKRSLEKDFIEFIVNGINGWMNDLENNSDGDKLEDCTNSVSDRFTELKDKAKIDAARTYIRLPRLLDELKRSENLEDAEFIRSINALQNRPKDLCLKISKYYKFYRNYYNTIIKKIKEFLDKHKFVPSKMSYEKFNSDIQSFFELIKSTLNVNSEGERHAIDYLKSQFPEKADDKQFDPNKLYYHLKEVLKIHEDKNKKFNKVFHEETESTLIKCENVPETYESIKDTCIQLGVMTNLTLAVKLFREQQTNDCIGIKIFEWIRKSLIKFALEKILEYGFNVIKMLFGQFIVIPKLIYLVVILIQKIINLKSLKKDVRQLKKPLEKAQKESLKADEEYEKDKNDAKKQIKFQKIEALGKAKESLGKKEGEVVLLYGSITGVIVRAIITLFTTFRRKKLIKKRKIR
jgi:uncharacterized membrane protein YuzA (DUF378 family)